MLQQERLQMIMDEIKRESAVTVHELSRKMNVSESTVRRDISLLDEEGRVRKVFGGAVSVDSVNSRMIISKESGMAEKSVLHVEEKSAIARYAAGLIEDDDFVFIDAGTTTGLFIEHLTNKNATYVTSGMRHALRLAELGFNAYIISGQAKYLTEAIAGALACESLSRYDFTKSFIGTNGMDPEKGFSTPDIEESMVKTEAIRRSMDVYVLADSSKFGAISSVSFDDPDEATIVTDECTDERFKTKTTVIEVDKES